MLFFIKEKYYSGLVPEAPIWAGKGGRPPPPPFKTGVSYSPRPLSPGKNKEREKEIKLAL